MRYVIGVAYVETYDPQGSIVQSGQDLAAGQSQYSRATYCYDGWGNLAGNILYAAGTEQIPIQPSGFGGQYGYYTDQETGLCLLGARYCDAGKGRFVNRDPIGYNGGQNLYAFCGNNPITGSDPSGNGPAASPGSGNHRFGSHVVPPYDPDAGPIGEGLSALWNQFLGDMNAMGGPGMAECDGHPCDIVEGSSGYPFAGYAMEAYQRSQATDPTSDQPIIDYLYMRIKRRFPNMRIEKNIKRGGREIDLDTEPLIIEVKSNDGTGLVEQVDTRITNTAVDPEGKPVVGFAFRMAPGIRRAINEKKGIAVGGSQSADAAEMEKTVGELLQLLDK